MNQLVLFFIMLELQMLKKADLSSEAHRNLNELYQYRIGRKLGAKRKWNMMSNFDQLL